MSIQRYDILHPKMRDKGRFILYADHIADKDADLHNLLFTIAEIRAALGVGEKPMLSDLPKIVREVREQADRDERAACKALAERDAAVEALRIVVDSDDRAAKRNAASVLAKIERERG